MKRNLKVFLLGTLVLGFSNLYGQAGLGKYLSDSVCKELLVNGSVQKMYDTIEPVHQLIPDCEFAEKCTGAKPANTDGMHFLSEQLYSIKKSELKADGADTLDISDVAMIFSSVSKMTGMTYFSSTRKKDMTLYKNVSFVKSVKDKTKLPDFAVTDCNGLSNSIVLDDASFGENVYKLNYYQNSDSLCLVLANEDAMGMGPIKAIKPGDMVIYYIVIDADDSYIIYLGVTGNFLKLPGVKKQVTDSLNARLEAVYTWFMKQF